MTPDRLFHTAPNATGTRAVFAAGAQWTDENPDLSGELFLYDALLTADIRVGRDSPTIVEWDTDARWRRYDVVRGDVANLAASGGQVDLGPVVCLEDESIDADTGGFGDPVDPAPGQVFFFLRRGVRGSTDPGGGYGQGTGGLERTAASGDCPN